MFDSMGRKVHDVRWVDVERGGTNSVGEEYEGALPDPYLDIEPMLDLMKRYADAARGSTSTVTSSNGR